MTKNSKRETIIDEGIDLEDVTYQEIINEINGICNHLTLEINKQIKQVEILTDEERWIKEKARREAQIISFRGEQIPRFEANILQEIEKQVNKQFKKIDISMFKQSEVHMGFSVENQRITGIGLFECLIGALPESIGKLKSLQILDLCSNALTTLPESIVKLKSLQVLSLINNKLNPLPESITKLKSLQSLYLGWNQLRTLPESIVNLSSLKSLWLPFNQLTTLPESISKLTTLKRLNLCNNPLARKPDSRTKSILKQLKKNNIDISL